MKKSEYGVCGSVRTGHSVPNALNRDVRLGSFDHRLNFDVEDRS